MTIGFASPWMLLGLPVAVLPLLLHLWLRRKAPVVPLDALMRLVLGLSGAARRVRLVHHALLMARVLLLVLLTVAFARPYREVPSSGLAGEQPVALAVVIDDSFSMRWARKDGNDFEEARQQAIRALGELPDASQVFLVRTTRPRETEPRRAPGMEPSQAAFWLERMSVTWQAGDLGLAVATARKILSGSPLPDRRILVISDFRNGDAESIRQDTPEGISLVRIDVTRGEPGENRAVLEARAVPDPESGSDAYLLGVEVWNGAPHPMNEVLSIRAGTVVEADRVECPPRRRCKVTLRLRLPGSVRSGEVRLPADGLPDDTAWFLVGSGNRGTILLLEGPHGLQGPSFFLGRALEVRTGGWTMEVRRAPAGGFSPLSLSGVAAVMAADTGPLSPDRVRLLEDFVRTGGVLWLAFGPGTPLETVQETWKPLLPGVLRRWRPLEEPPEGLRPGLLPGASFLSGPVAAAFRETRVRQVVLLEGGWPGGWKTLAEVGPDLPLWLEGRVGEGRVLLWLTSLDPTGTDLPLSPGFVSWLRESLEWAIEGGSGRGAALVRPGEEWPLKWMPGDRELQVAPPSGPSLTVRAPGGFLAWTSPGVHEVLSREDRRGPPTLRDRFIVQTDPSESIFREPSPQAEPASGTGTALQNPDVGPRTRHRSLVTPVLLAALLLMMGEAFLRGRS